MIFDVPTSGIMAYPGSIYGNINGMSMEIAIEMSKEISRETYKEMSRKYQWKCLRKYQWKCLGNINGNV